MVYRSISFWNAIIILFTMGVGFLCYAETPPQAEVKSMETEAKPMEAEAKPMETEVEPVEAEAKPTETEVEPVEAEAKPTEIENKPCAPISDESISKLQSERTPTKERVSLIQLFADLEKDNLQECLQTVTDKEMIGLTIIELARHTDKVLAQKAQSIEKQFDIISYVDKSFVDLTGKIPPDIITLLLRIESDRVQTVLSSLSLEKKKIIERKLSHYVSTILIPTGSPEGDRYYVKIVWDKEDNQQVDCLIKFLHQELLAGRSIEAEKKKMQELTGQRWVYWYDKGWAISVFDQALQCRAKPSFVKGYVN